MSDDRDGNGGQAWSEFARAVVAGLGNSPKTLPCMYLYDEAGSRIFDEICDVQEYYVPAAEREILLAHAGEIAELFPAPCVLVELGSGSAAKTRILIDALLRRQGTLRYIPIDIAEDALAAATSALQVEYPALQITGVCAECEEGLRRLAGLTEGEPKLVLFLGSSLGNYEPTAAAELLRHIHRSLSERDRMLVGVDLRKDRATLEAAYDDAKGVTARFNLNLLARINRELGGHFDLGAFRHRAVFNEEAGRIEMHLVSLVAQRVAIDTLGVEVPFEAGETIHTENSYKYAPREIAAMAANAGFRLDRQWFDARRRFSQNVLAPA